ncbi:YjgP/YjgQ family permease [bacterium]|nr:YjgP/YjgQ family permease [bacterium]
MRILDRYILGEFLKKFFAILVLFALILLLKDVLGELAEVLSHDPAPYWVVMFFLNRLPLELVQVIPVSVILAMMFGVGAMAKRKELLAMHASGLSYLRLAVPLLVAAILLTALVFYVNDRVLPGCWLRARYIEKVKIKGEPHTKLTTAKNITTKGKGSRFYTMERFDSQANLMEAPTITDVGTSPVGVRVMRRRIDADWAEYLGEKVPDDEPEGRKRLFWRFHNAIVMRFDEYGRLAERRHYDTTEIAMEEDLDRFLATNRRDQEMNFAELREFVAIQGERNQGEYYRRLKTEMYGKAAFPLAVFFLGMLGYTFAVRSSIRSLVLEFGLAILCIVFWYAFYGSANRLGRMGIMPPILAAWYGNVLFFFLLLWRFRRLEKVPR